MPNVYTVSAFEYVQHGHQMFAELALVRELSDDAPAIETHYAQAITMYTKDTLGWLSHSM